MIVPGAELVIYDPTNADAPTSVGIRESIPINITIAIADVREPDKRNSSFSKTINIPGSKTVNKLFEHIFDVTTELADFNPNLKTRCEYFVRSEKVFSGDIQLLRIVRKGISPSVEISYECSIVGRLANVFLDLGNALLEDLDFSDLNHTFGWANRNWSPTLGTGYTYPLIEYGIGGGYTQYWDFKHLKPAIFEKEYIDRIFESIGKTYTSTYMSSTYETSMIIPDVNEGALKMTASQINSVSFYAGKTADTTTNIPIIYVPALTSWTTGYNINTLAGTGNFNDDSTSPFYDGGNNYSTVTFAYTAPVDIEFKANSLLNLQVRTNHSLYPAGVTSMTIDGGVYGFRASIAPTGYGSYYGYATTTSNLSTWTDFSINLSMPNLSVIAGTTIYVTIETDSPTFMGTKFFNGGTPVTGGTASIDVKLLDTSWFSGTSATGNLPLGYTVDMNGTVPKNVKQIDFLMSIIKSENLYMELDLTDSNNYIIEQREDFFLEDAANTLDWTDKWDFQKETTIIPMGELDWREYLFTYKKDGDKYNKLYFDEFNEVYGTEQIYVENDFNQSVKKNELIFASTPMVGNSLNRLIYPVIAQEDGLNLKPMKAIIRRLYFGGLLQLGYPVGDFFWMLNATNGVNNTTLATYPFCGHVDNPYSPTLDICFDNPKKLYYNYPGIIYTNNNLYVRNYQKFIEQITDANSKIVIMWMRLTPTDIAKFTFRKRIWIHDSYYIVNKIFDYNPQEDGLTKVEFLRLAFIDAPVTEEIIIWNNGEGASSSFQYGIIIDNPDSNPNGNASESDGIANGSMNVNQGGQSNILGGYNNVIGNGGEF